MDRLPDVALSDFATEIALSPLRPARANSHSFVCKLRTHVCLTAKVSDRGT